MAAGSVTVSASDVLFRVTMANGIAILPDAQLEPLQRTYAQAVARRRRNGAVSAAVLALCIAAAGIVGEVDLPKLAGNIWRFPNYLKQLVPALTWAHFGADMAEWFWGWKPWSKLLLETLLIAYLGTLFGAVGGFLTCFFSAGNVAASRVALFASRRCLEFCRTVPEIVFALIFVVAFGLGPLPGVLALAIHTAGALGKQFAEVIENIDMKPVDGLTATGASWAQTMRFAVVPQVLSNFVSYTLLRFELNVRGAAIMGFVGAGGIGQELLTAIRKFYYSDISAILIMIIGTVMLIDLATERVRHALLGLDERK